MRHEQVRKALEAELERQLGSRELGLLCVDGSLDLHALAAALAPVLFAEPSQRARDIAEGGTATMLDAAYAARDLLPLLRAIKPEEQATVLDYLNADPRRPQPVFTS